jgi:hypothetical protein
MLSGAESQEKIAAPVSIAIFCQRLELHISPIGILKNASIWKCRNSSSWPRVLGGASSAGQSDATADK